MNEEKKAGFLQDDTGAWSSTRLVFLGAFVVSVLFGAAVIVGAFLHLEIVVSAGTALIVSFIGLCGAVKIGQSFSEKQ